MREFLGIVVGAQSGEVKAVINPDSDDELADPNWLLLRGGKDETVRMMKVPRGPHKGALSLADVAKLVEQYQK